MADVTITPEAIAEGRAILARLARDADPQPASRNAIMQSAAEVFARKGFHGSSLKDIAVGANLSTAALYVHFASKEDLLFVMSLRGHTIARELVAAAATGPDPVTSMQVLAYSFTRWHAEQRTTARVVQYELSALDDEHADQIREIRHDTERVVRELVDRGMAADVFHVPDVRAATAAVLSLGIDVARWFEPHGRWDPHTLSVLYAKLALQMVGVRSPE